MGDKIISVVVLAIYGAMLGDLLVHKDGTDALFGGMGRLASSTYQAAAGAYSHA